MLILQLSLSFRSNAFRADCSISVSKRCGNCSFQGNQAWSSWYRYVYCVQFRLFAYFQFWSLCTTIMECFSFFRKTTYFRKQKSESTQVTSFKGGSIFKMGLGYPKQKVESSLYHDMFVQVFLCWYLSYRAMSSVKISCKICFLCICVTRLSLSIPLAMVQDMLLELLKCTLGEENADPATHLQQDLTALPDHSVFAIQLYHRW